MQSSVSGVAGADNVFTGQSDWRRVGVRATHPSCALCKARTQTGVTDTGPCTRPGCTTTAIVPRSTLVDTCRSREGACMRLRCETHSHTWTRETRALCNEFSFRVSKSVNRHTFSEILARTTPREISPAADRKRARLSRFRSISINS